MINTRRDIPMLNLGPTRLALLVGALGALGCGSDAGVSTGGTGGTDGQTRTALAGKADCSPEVGAAVVCGVVYAADGVTPLPVVEVRLRDPSAGLSSKGVADPNKCITDAVGAFACILPEGTTGTTEFTVVAPGFDTLSFTVKVVEGEIAEADRLEMAAVCGDDTIRETETCDGIDLAGNTCADFGFTGGTLGCLSDCSSFDTSGCSGGPVCGDNAAEPPEVCDGTDLAGEDCASQGFAGGTLGCKADCTGFDTSSCSGGPVCGDDTIRETETCDGIDLAGNTCADFGFTGGTLGCKADCTGFDTSSCSGGPVCGDDTIRETETCDGIDLAGNTCADFGFTGGTLGCKADCTGFDTSSCSGGPVCGDDTIRETETCDGIDLAGDTCADFGFTGGTLGCEADCTGFDTGGCTSGPVCGDDAAEPPEVCDGTDLAGEDCASQGFAGGTLGCEADCTGFDTGGCSRGRCAVTTRPSLPRSATERTWQAKIVRVRGSPGARWGAKRTARASTPAAARRGRCAVTTRPSLPRSATAGIWRAKIV